MNTSGSRAPISTGSHTGHIQTGLFILAVLYTLYFARPILLPAVLALFLGFLLSPLVSVLKRLRVPEPIGAAIVLALLIVTVAFGVQRLTEPASEWLVRAPRTFQDLGQRVQAIKEPVEQASKAAEEAERIAQISSEQNAPKVQVEKPSLGEVLLTETWKFMLGAVTTLALLYLFLASGNRFLVKLVRVVPRMSGKKRAVEVIRQIEKGISTYLVTVSLSNIVLGAAVTLALAWLEVPNPLLWGVVVGVLNYIPYLGALASLTILALVAVTAFHDLSRIVAVLLVFSALNSIEGMIVRPMILGKGLALNPVAVFAGLIFWGWIWGAAGALIAVPLLASVKLVCDEFESLAPVSEFLGP